MLAGLFMVAGTCGLLFIGREKARIIGQTITELDLQPLMNTDKPITPEMMTGKVVVLHFWGFWCGPCALEYPSFAKVQRAFKGDESVLFLSVSCSDKPNDTDESLGFYTKKFLDLYGGEEFPIYSDPVEYSRAQLSKLMTTGGFSYPTTLVLDGQGKVSDIWRDAVTEKTLVSAIEKAKLAKP
jgi:thiol-disulfide isomerase/thioredoxin